MRIVKSTPNCLESSLLKIWKCPWLFSGFSVSFQFFNALTFPSFLGWYQSCWYIQNVESCQRSGNPCDYCIRYLQVLSWEINGSVYLSSVVNYSPETWQQIDSKKADYLGVGFKCMDTFKQLSINCYKTYWKKNCNQLNLKVNCLPRYESLLSMNGQGKLFY